MKGFGVEGLEEEDIVGCGRMVVVCCLGLQLHGGGGGFILGGSGSAVGFCSNVRLRRYTPRMVLRDNPHCADLKVMGILALRSIPASVDNCLRKCCAGGSNQGLHP